jgi:murein DD-endopeptidase MepM/ murein hydrolase activator NlpD
MGSVSRSHGAVRRWLLGAALVAALAGAGLGLEAGRADAEGRNVDVRAQSRRDVRTRSATRARVEREARAEAPAPAPEEEAEQSVGVAPVEDSPTAIIPTRLPERWLPRGRRCGRRGRRMICDGPRRVPRPFGEAAALAAELGIGDRAMASRLLGDRPEEAWLTAIGSEPREDMLWPVPDGKLWRGFGYTRTGRLRRRLHKGIDIGAPEGSPIRAVNDGLIVYANNELRGYGNLMMILHADATISFYAHAKTLYLFPGQRVMRGQAIGEVGHTGLARGDHVHFEWYRNGRPRNPIRLMVGRPDDDPPTQDDVEDLDG